jgi:uncharacterized protein DUF2442
MSTSAPTTDVATARDVRITSRTLTVHLRDGRSLSVPVAWYPRLANAAARERRRWELIGPGIGIHWPAVDEDISVEALLRGLPSGESQASLQRWLETRRPPANRRIWTPPVKR